MNNISLKDYWNMLAQHDWFYEYSDDHRMYCEGRDNAQKLWQLAERDPAYKDLYIAYRKYVFGVPAKPGQPVSQPPCPS